jgi:hypothetical protein
MTTLQQREEKQENAAISQTKKFSVLYMSRKKNGTLLLSIRVNEFISG